MERVNIKNLGSNVGKEVLIKGWVNIRRDQGKMVFFDLRDATGVIQCVVLPNSNAIDTAKEMRTEWVLSVRGIVNKRPEKNVVSEKVNGDIEMEVKEITVLNKAVDLPFDLSSEINLDTHLDYLPFTLKTERSKDIFTLQSSILESYRQSLRDQGFLEFVAPALVGGDAEGGAAAFKVEYFKDKTAFLATSPQFYKQIMVNSFERAFTVAKIFRAEKSATTRHLSEATCIDFEMGFIESEIEVMDVLQKSIQDVVKYVSVKHPDIFSRFKTEIPLVPEKFPVFTLKEAHEIVAKEFNRTIEDNLDMSPEDERQICQYAKEKYKSDFVFITRFPTKKRAFYTYEDKNEAPFSRGFDLLFRGLEINSGAQRIHNYDDLVFKMQERGLDIEKFSFYLQAFKYGIPPHGGCSTGLERITARMLQIVNVKEATSFPRDMTRIDNRISE